MRYRPPTPTGSLPHRGEWRSLADDPDELAPRFARAARWASYGADVEPPLRTGDAAAYIDDLDEWLEALHPGRRSFAWFLVVES